MPDESDTALLYVDRGLVRADQGPPDRTAQRRAHSRARASRWVRRGIPVLLLLTVAALLLSGAPGALLWVALPVVLLAGGVATVVAARAARTAHAVAGLPVPIEIVGKVAPAMRAIQAMTRALAGRRPARGARAAGEAVAVLRRWTASAEGLRAAWLRGDVADWHEHARALVTAGEQAGRVRADLAGDEQETAGE